MEVEFVYDGDFDTVADAERITRAGSEYIIVVNEETGDAVLADELDRVEEVTDG